MVSMVEAEKIALGFVKEKRPEYEPSVKGVSRTQDGWEVKGVLSRKVEHGRISEEWVVTIEDGEVISYEFGRSTGYVII